LDFFLVGWLGLPFGDRDIGSFSMNPVPLANVSPSGLTLAVIGQPSLAPVPLPASGLLLLFGAGALVALRRRKG
ncbi:MAG: VPLPA-CTERM sorting domain-containing protein, partial [Pseudomonadota bacterium]